MSKNIIIAGPGGLAKHFLDILLPNPAFKITVLTRTAKPDLEARGASVSVVDYASVPSLTAALRAASADTVLSFLVNFEDPEGQALAQRNLVRASVDAGVRRFVPAEYANNVRDYPEPASGEKDKQAFRDFVRAEAARSGLEYTLVCCGLISDFLLPLARRAKKHFPEFPGPVDTEKGVVLVLGEPGQRISCTAADDVARAMVRVLTVPLGAWDEYTWITGDSVTYAGLADSLERVTGDKVERVYLPLPELEKQLGEAVETGDVMAIVGAELNLLFGNGSISLPENSKVLDGLDFVKVEDLFQSAYGKK